MLTRQNAIDKINVGYGIINHIDHSNPYVMSMGSLTGGGGLTVNDVDNLTNGNNYSVVYSAGCSPGAFDYDCIGEHFVLKNNGGAVAFVGPSRSVYTWDGNNHDHEFFRSLFTNDYNKIGQTLALTWYSDHTRNIYNLLGDPEMSIWTAAPQTLTVSHPTTVQIGAGNFTVTISNLPAGRDALICLKKGVEDYAVNTVTGTGGAVNATFLFTPDTPGDLSITVTAENFIPYEATTSVTSTSGANLYMLSYTIDDDQSGESSGNGDGIVDAGESIELPVVLKNSGSSTAIVVSATIAAYQRGTTNPHPYVTITDGSESFGNISAGSSASCGDDFGFTISKDCPKDEVVEFKLTITDDESSTWLETFYLQIGAPQIQHTAHTVNGNLLADATVGLVVQLTNLGSSVAKGITASLSSSCSYIASITGSPQTVGDINPKSSVNSPGAFSFTIGSGYPSGHEELLTFALTIQDAYGKTWAHDFDLKRPNSPSFASLQFNGYETAIDLIWTPNTDSDLRGYNVYRSDSPTGTYQRANNRLIEGTSYFRDDGLEKETMYYYKISAVDQSANESDLTTYLETSTTIKYLSGWPIRIDYIPFASTVLFDVDNDGDQEVFAADISTGDKIYAWDHSGLELFDTDGNPTTLSGFFHESGANFWSTPAIGDLDGNGINELVIAGRGNHFLYCWHINDADINGSPDPYWSVDIGGTCVGSPALGDIDGDGKLEVVLLSEDGKVHIRKFDGSVYQTEPWKTIGGSVGSYCTPALFDFDGDGRIEIILGGNDGKLHVWRYDGSYYSANWPFDTGRNNFSAAPAVADLDRDGKYEIIFVAYDWGSTASNCVIYVKDEYGNDKSGWSGGKSISAPAGVVSSSPAIGNLDGDNQLEIVFATGSNVYAWNHDYSSLSGWPKAGFSGTTSSPLISDIDEISGPEVIVGSSDKKLHAWHSDGTAVKGWPLRTGDILESSPAVGDVDGDGKYELAVGSYDQSVHIWDTKGSSNMDWSVFQHDAQHMGCYGQIVSGTVTRNTSWQGEVTANGNIIVATGATLTIASGATVNNISHITVQTGATLIVNSGVTLKFNSAPTPSYEGSPKGSLGVNGKIHADGATFTSNSSNSDYYWAGIYVINSNPGGDGNYFKNCIIQQCKFGMTIYNSRFDGSSDEIYNNTFTHCLNPIRLTGGSYVNRITYNHLTDNLEDGIVIYQSTVQHVDHTLIQKSQAASSGRDGFWISGSYNQPLLTHNEVAYGYSNGIRCEYYSAPNLGGPDGGNAVPGNNGIHDNAVHGVYAQSSTQPFLGNYNLSECASYGGYNSIFNNSNKQLYVATGSQFVNAKWNWWGVVPDDGDNGFTSNTMASLFGNGFPYIRPALSYGPGGYPEAPFTESMELYKKSAIVIPHESILLAFGDQLMIAKRYDRACAVYDSLIASYPASDEAEAALLRLHYAMQRFNAALKAQPFLGQAKDAADYFTKLASRVARTRLERNASNLSVVNAAMQGQTEPAIKGYEFIIQNWSGEEESEKYALAALVELYLKIGDGKAADARMATLNSKYPHDALTSLVNDMVYLIRKYVPPIQTTPSGSGDFSDKSRTNEDTSKKKNAEVPLETMLHPSYPNPFNPMTSVSYTLSEPGLIDLVVFDILGRKVVELAHGYQSAGVKSIHLDGSKFPSGTYFLRLNAQGKLFTQRLLLVK